MNTVDNNISECRSIQNPGEHPQLNRQRTLRRDLSHDGPREFRHISRLNSDVKIVTCEKQQSSSNPEYNGDILDDIHQYFSGLNTPHLNTSIKPPKIRVTRQLTKDDITYPTNFIHIAHINYKELKKNIENMTELGRKQSPNASSVGAEFPINTREHLTKDDISEPTDFRHVAHMGFEDNKLRMNTEDTTIKFSFDKAGTFTPQSQEKDNLTNLLQNHSGRNKENAQRKIITKEDIGYPENFQHLVHVDLNSAFNPENMFVKAPASTVDVKDKELQNFISEIIDDDAKPQAVIKPVPKPRSIRKVDIQKPQQFRHNAHISYHKDKPTSVNDNDAILQHFFRKAGVTDEQLMNEETRKFIFDFIRQHSKCRDDKNNQPKPIPHTYKNLAEKLQSEADRRSKEEYSEILLALYSRTNPI